jgi:hypothetical protein
MNMGVAKCCARAEFIGTPPQIQACLAQNKASLSTPCRQVVEAHGG